MKKIIIAALCCALILTGCAEQISREITDTRYAPAYEAIETTYENRYSFLAGGFTLVPNTRTVHHPDRWEVRYTTTYDNGQQTNYWETVTEQEYLTALADLAE